LTKLAFKNLVLFGLGLLHFPPFSSQQRICTLKKTHSENSYNNVLQYCALTTRWWCCVFVLRQCYGIKLCWHRGATNLTASNGCQLV